MSNMSSVKEQTIPVEPDLSLQSCNKREQTTRIESKDDDAAGLTNISSTNYIGSSEVLPDSKETLQVTESVAKHLNSLARSKPVTKKQVVKEELPENSEHVEAPVRKTPTKRKRRRRLSGAQVFSVPSDPVIEQWYTDPYNRYDPEGPADRQLRVQNLTIALRNRGFRGGRIVNVVNWLIRCKGQFKDYDDLVGRRFRRMSKARRNTLRRGIGVGYEVGTPDNTGTNEQARHTPVTPSNDVADTIQYKSNTGEGVDSESDLPKSLGAVYPSPTSNSYDFDDHGDLSTLHKNRDCVDEGNNPFSNLCPDLESEVANHDLKSNLESANDSDVDDDDDFATEPSEPLTEHEVAALNQLQSSLQPARPTFVSAHKPGTQAYKDDYDDWYLEALKRTQKFWKMIYGDDLDNEAHLPAGSKARHKNKEIKVEHEIEDDDEGDNLENVNSNVDEDEENPGVKFTWFREPGGMPTVDVRYRTQGLKPLKKAMYRGKEVLTEDQTFGLCASR